MVAWAWIRLLQWRATTDCTRMLASLQEGWAAGKESVCCYLSEPSVQCAMCNLACDLAAAALALDGLLVNLSPVQNPSTPAP